MEGKRREWTAMHEDRKNNNDRKVKGIREEIIHRCQNSEQRRKSTEE